MEDQPGRVTGPGGPVTRRRALVLGAGGAAGLLGGAAFLGTRSRAGGGPPRLRAGDAAAFDPDEAAPLFANRARAVRDGDRAAFLATAASAPPAFQEAQSRLYDNLRRLPLERWRERVVAPHTVDADGAAVVRVEVRHRLRGFDRGDVVAARHLALASRSGTWTIVGDGSPHGLRDDPAIWDGGDLAVAEGRRSLVIGDAPGIEEIAARLDAAVPVVTGVVGSGWARRAVALVPADPALASGLAGPEQNLHGIAALATVTPAAAGARGEDRVIISPGTFGRLNELGRDVVLTHELTHVATGGARDRDTPLWLIEGFADYVGYLTAKVGVRAAAGELRREVAAGRLPSALPSPDAFSGDAERRSRSYQESWLACRMVASRYGEATLVRLYRTAGRVPEAVALRDVLGLTRGRFIALWRDYLTRELT